MSADLLRPIRWLDAVDHHGHLVTMPVDVVPMTERMSARWHAEVQPVVDGHYAATSDRTSPIRADVGWNWTWLRRLATMHTVLSRIPGVKSGAALAFSLTIATRADPQFPIGMLTCVPQFHCMALDEQRHRSFAWHLSDAPREVYEALGCARVMGVAQALVDCTIQAAVDIGETGALLLRADPAGGERLRRFYRDHCLMDSLPALGPPVSWLRRTHPTEEYFHLDSTQANCFSMQFDSQRQLC